MSIDRRSGLELPMTKHGQIDLLPLIHLIHLSIQHEFIGGLGCAIQHLPRSQIRLVWLVLN